MSATQSNEFRRARRRKLADTVHVVDTMTDTVIGRLGNISETGMLLFGTTTLVEDALYQLRFNLHNGEQATPIEVGAHLLWQDPASGTGQQWTGFRFISMSERETLALRDWIDAPGGSYE